MPPNLPGLWLADMILMKWNLPESKKSEVLTEKFSPILTYGNITNQSYFNNRKFENYARRYGIEMLIPINKIIETYKQGIHNLYELANFFEVTEGFVLDCIEHYKCKYGLKTLCGDYLIEFEPLRVFEIKNIL
ncbi:toxin [Staphylococcus coagulans]|uniref:toxin n=1 Tax=Staphylococcus coagulans TaxID=74706 RepID=UPI00336500F7